MGTVLAKAAPSQTSCGQDCTDQLASAESEAAPRESARPKLPPSCNLEKLEAEVECLRKDVPTYVSYIGSLSVPQFICLDGRLVAPEGDTGPWDLSVTIAGSPTQEAYNYPFRLLVRFDTRWPGRYPLVQFQSIIHHALLDDDNGMLSPFYRKLPKDGQGCYTLRSVLHAVYKFLEDPLASWGIPRETAPQRLLRSLQSNQKQNTERLTTIRNYSELSVHKELFTAPPGWQAEWFDPAFWRAQQESTPEAWRDLLTEHLTGEVFSFRLFSDAFCDMLVEEIFHFYGSGLPAKRPNSMNNYGIIINDIGLEPFIDRLQQALQPLGQLLWPDAGSCWDGHHCFIVRYREGEDLGLDMHTDDSDVTFNVCLGLEFTGAGLQFCGAMGAPEHRKHTYTYQHRKGCCVCHLGRRRHGADDITLGERLNLILWNRSSTYRQTTEYKDPPYSKEDGLPDEVCVSYTHDRDFGLFKEYPAGKEHFQGRGWCPPKPYEYDGFKPDEEHGLSKSS